MDGSVSAAIHEGEEAILSGGSDSGSVYVDRGKVKGVTQVYTAWRLPVIVSNDGIYEEGYVFSDPSRKEDILTG